LNQQQKKELSERKRGVLVTEWGQDTKHQKHLVGSGYDKAYSWCAASNFATCLQ